MDLATIYVSILVIMSANATLARGESVVERPIEIRLSYVRAKCAQDYVKHFARDWPSIAPRNAARVAAVLCEDNRVLFEFARVIYPDQAMERMLDRLDTETYTQPLTLGLTGLPFAELKQIAHAIRSVRHPLSNTLHAYRRPGTERFQNWLKSSNGGQFSGVIYATISGGDPLSLRQDVDTVKQVMERTSAKSEHANFDAYTLLIMSESDRVDGKDVRDLVAGSGRAPVRWIELESNACVTELM